ncbi:MAG: CPBP family intramembrane metalloprotease [Clostridia bacterium]|nr:CPBP family intramembrane metalloprotease [Clostridia bacterium]
MSKKEIKVLDQVNIRYGPFEKWYTWAWLLTIFFYFLFPNIVSIVISLSPTAIALFSNLNISWYILLSIVVQYYITFIFVIACFGKYIWRSIVVFHKKFFPNIGKTFLLYVAALIGANIAGRIIYFLSPRQENSNENSIDNIMSVLPVFMAIVTTVLAPVCEEVIFRWGIFRPLYRRSPAFAHIFTALLFAFVHVMGAVFGGDYIQLINMLAYLPVAFALSFAYEWTGSFWAPILLHMAWNTMATFG